MTTDARRAGVAPSGPKPVRMAKSKFGGLAVVCAKCAKRQGLPAKAVRKLLKDAYADLLPTGGGGKGKGRKLCVIETGCLGPCPKRAVAVATGASLAAGRVLLLDPAAGREGARAALLPEFGPIAGLAGSPNPDEGGDDSPRIP
ncbi:hypothetical protein [Methylobacterium sp. J-076]|uniref:hypothetical protein n=1 Tax=Methylobacterium sp. J-076 TaxID=2836655 RepID=UPI001FB99548|nr:hypothetical protein [Methylobacterium sp. J-076]MCJ2011394.1 hypothetical protein [Methylobacterium sp. J-076]